MAEAIYGDAPDFLYDEETGKVDGYSFTGTKGRAVYEWLEAKDDKAFKKLLDRLRQKKWWSELTPDEKEQVYKYRRAWAKAHPKRVKQYLRKSKAKRRKNGKALAGQRAYRAKLRAERVKTIVYVCSVCAHERRQDPAKRIPSISPKYCSQRCRSRAAYLRLMAQEENVGSGSLTAHAGYGGRIKLLRSLGGDLTVARLIVELGYSKRYARNTLGDLFGKGQLDRPMRGVYRVKEAV